MEAFPLSLSPFLNNREEWCKFVNLAEKNSGLSFQPQLFLK